MITLFRLLRRPGWNSWLKQPTLVEEESWGSVFFSTGGRGGRGGIYWTIKSDRLTTSAAERTYRSVVFGLTLHRVHTAVETTTVLIV